MRLFTYTVSSCHLWLERNLFVFGCKEPKARIAGHRTPRTPRGGEGAERSLPSLTTKPIHPFSCIRSVAELELKDPLEFEMELARISMPREMRRDINRMYNPMMIR